MKDQLAHWNNAHSEHWLREHSTKQTSFAEEVNDKIAPGSTLLELGCGEGNDSIYFAQQGHVVAATDFSEVAVNENQKHLVHDNLHFAVQDISQLLAFDDASFDVVYARLSLHYFTDAVTKSVFNEIARILKPGGTLHFMCKSTDDGLWGQGDEIEADMYELNGHVRHFFSPAYARELLNAAGLQEVSTVSGNDKLYDRQSAFIRVEARK